MVSEKWINKWKNEWMKIIPVKERSNVSILQKEQWGISIQASFEKYRLMMKKVYSITF